MPDRLESYKVICRGGLNSNENSLDLADSSPGSATRLVNYEPSLFGGYRRVEGFKPFDPNYPEVDDGSGAADGKVLCIVMFRNEEQGNAYAIAARKDFDADTYSFYKHVPLVGWQKMDTGLSQATTDGVRTVNKIRHVQFDFGDGGKIAFADGVNPAKVFDGVDWYEITAAGDGTEEIPGGPQAVDAPALVDAFENHLFLSGDRAAPSVVCHSAPNDPLNFNSGAGAGQIPVGFNIVQFKPFRDNLFVFGSNAIKRIKPEVQAGFVVEQVTANVGCIARDSVQEIGGDLIFLAPDGFRPVAGTSRIGDVELETISKEFVLHGDYDGRVYRQEVGNNFDGEDIVSIYSTPYLDFGDTEIRKVLHKINTFIRAEGPFTLNVTLDYDWGDTEVAKPSAYSQSSTGAPTVYGGRSIDYGGDNVQYGGNSKPVMLSDIQGSGYSARATFVTVGQSAPHSIQGMVFEFALAGRR